MLGFPSCSASQTQQPDSGFRPVPDLFLRRRILELVAGWQRRPDAYLAEVMGALPVIQVGPEDSPAVLHLAHRRGDTGSAIPFRRLWTRNRSGLLLLHATAVVSMAELAPSHGSPTDWPFLVDGSSGWTLVARFRGSSSMGGWFAWGGALLLGLIVLSAAETVAGHVPRADDLSILRQWMGADAVGYGLGEGGDWRDLCDHGPNAYVYIFGLFQKETRDLPELRIHLESRRKFVWKL